jgi:methionine aminopeptidase
LVLLTLLSLVHRSVNEVICHGIPDARKLEDGDIVNVDVTVYYKGAGLGGP